LCIIGASKADTQPRNEVRSVVSAGPSCQRRREASNHSPGLLDSFPGAVAPAPAKFSDSTLMERSGKAGRQWGDRAAESSLARSPAAGCQTNLVLPVSSDVSVRRNVACEMEAVRKWPISRLLAGVPAPTSATGGASRRNAVTWPDEVTRPYYRSWPICGASRPLVS
jgi:hypothetical protein